MIKLNQQTEKYSENVTQSDQTNRFLITRK